MQDSGVSAQRRDALAFVLVVALFVLSPPLIKWWLAADSTWYFPYLIWAVLLGAGVVFQRIGKHDV